MPYEPDNRIDEKTDTIGANGWIHPSDLVYYNKKAPLLKKRSTGRQTNRQTGLPIGCLNQLHQRRTLFRHHAGVSVVFLVLITEQVQNAVHQEFVQTNCQRYSRSVAFPFGGVDRDHDIAEQLGRDIGEFAFTHRKGDDIGRSRPTQVLSVQLSDGGIIDEQYGKLRLRTAQGV